MKQGVKESVRSTTEDFFHAMDTRNMDLMQSLMPENYRMVHVGTDRGEIWKGYSHLIKTTAEHCDELEYYKATIRNLSVDVHAAGDLAWYFHQPDAEIKSHGSVTKLEDARFTGVVHKNGAQWQIVQTHVSLPINI